MPGNETPPDPHPSLSLLLAEDEVMVAWNMVEMTKSLGYRVCATVTTENEAIESAVRLRPDVVVLDYRLAGDGNGLRAARLIRETEDVPIIFCTAYGESLRPQLEALPRVYVLTKPVSLGSLRRALAWTAEVRGQVGPVALAKLDAIEPSRRAP